MRNATPSIAALSALLSLAAPTFASNLKSAFPTVSPRFRAASDAPEDRAERLRLAYRKAFDDGLDRMLQGRYEFAIAAFDKATRLKPDSAEAFFRLGDAYYHQVYAQLAAKRADDDDANLAITAYRQAQRLDPEAKTISEAYLLHHGMAMCLRALRRYDEALAELRKAMACSPENPMPPLYAAEVRYEMRDLPLATANLQVSIQRARQLKSYPALAKFVRGDSTFSNLLGIPQNQAMLQVYDRLQAGEITETQARDMIQEASTYRDALRNTAESLSGYRLPKPAARVEPDPTVVEHVGRGHAEFKYRRWLSAIQEYDAALKANEARESLDQGQKSIVLEQIGICYRMLGQTGESLRALRTAVAESPRNASAYYQMALSYAMAGKVDSSLQALDRSLRGARSVAELRQTLLLAKTDAELDGIRDNPAFENILRPNEARLQAVP